MANNQNKNCNIQPIEEFLCIGNYEKVSLIQSITRNGVIRIKNNEELDPTKDIYIVFLSQGIINTIPNKKDDLKQFFYFIRIYSGPNYYVNIIIEEKDKNDQTLILNKINNSNLKDEFIKRLKINQFSVTDYYLIEKKGQINMIDRIFILTNKNNNNIKDNINI